MVFGLIRQWKGVERTIPDWPGEQKKLWDRRRLERKGLWFNRGWEWDGGQGKRKEKKGKERTGTEWFFGLISDRNGGE